ncbi:hypothetical protein LJK88_17000 [Paenibacillus sp. P26]|nr:hypothetical protein LJK88_17000 [Paenibacillus sp. P26]
MLSGRWDEELRAGRKSLRTLPGTLLLGPTGARLWADYLDPEAGFSGRFDFIHKVNIPLLFKVTQNLERSLEPCRTEWSPSHLLMEYESGRLTLSERKFIAWNDCAVSCQTWSNLSGEELVLRLETYEDAFRDRRGGICMACSRSSITASISQGSLPSAIPVCSRKCGFSRASRPRSSLRRPWASQARTTRKS